MIDDLTEKELCTLLRELKRGHPNNLTDEAVFRLFRTNDKRVNWREIIIERGLCPGANYKFTALGKAILRVPAFICTLEDLENATNEEIDDYISMRANSIDAKTLGKIKLMDTGL